MNKFRLYPHLAIPVSFALLFSAQIFAGDKINLSTGEIIMDMGGGDKMNLDTGEIIIDLGADDDW